jgi:hypothetical protein
MRVADGTGVPYSRAEIERLHRGIDLVVEALRRPRRSPARAAAE